MLLVCALGVGIVQTLFVSYIVMPVGGNKWLSL